MLDAVRIRRLRIILKIRFLTDKYLEQYYIHFFSVGFRNPLKEELQMICLSARD